MSNILDISISPPTMNLIEIGHVVGARRAELGLTQAQLAHLSGLSTVLGR
jgi:hypothetical protein